jgi:hypothetical protein
VLPRTATPLPAMSVASATSAATIIAQAIAIGAI